MEQVFHLVKKQFELVITKPPFSQITINLFKFQIMEQQGFFFSQKQFGLVITKPYFYK